MKALFSLSNKAFVCVLYYSNKTKKRKNKSGIFSLFTKQKIAEINAKNNMLESRLEDANKLLEFYKTREKSLVDGKFLFFLKKKMFLMRFFVKENHPGAFNVFDWRPLLAAFWNYSPLVSRGDE